MTDAESGIAHSLYIQELLANVFGREYKIQKPSHILLKIPLEDENDEDADENNNRGLFLCPFSAAVCLLAGSWRRNGFVCHRSSADGCGFRKGTLRKK